MLDWDFGVPLGGQRCKETVPNVSGIFTREWSNAVVTLDTNTNKAIIKMKAVHVRAQKTDDAAFVTVSSITVTCTDPAMR